MALNGIDADRSGALSREALAFAPALLAIQESPPAPLPRAVLYTVAVLVGLLMLWAGFGKLDVIASAQGRLIPRTYDKIVQPAEAGIVREILVREGQSVAAGQVLVRMDRQDAQADSKALATALAMKSLQLHRIDAELTGSALTRRADEPADLFERVQAQYEDHRRAYLSALAQSQDSLRRARRDEQAGVDTLDKLRRTKPLLQAQAQTYADLGKDGDVSRMQVYEKQQQYIENEQDLLSQQAKVGSLQAAVGEAQQQVDETTSKYLSDLQNERIQAEGEFIKLQQDFAKQSHKSGLLELRAPQAGVVNDLATHTVGTVVSAGTVLLSLVPEHEPMRAEVMIRNEDVGFVHAHQPVQVKLAAYPFQKYGMLHGEVVQVWPDAARSDSRSDPIAAVKSSGSSSDASAPANSGGYRALIDLKTQSLDQGGLHLKLLAGMDVIAEIDEGRRTVLEYLLSPVQKIVQQSGRER